MGNNIQRTPISFKAYYDLFMLENRVFEKEDRVLLLTIGYAETTIKLIKRFAKAERIVAVDMESECDYIEFYCCELHNISNVCFKPVQDASEIPAVLKDMSSVAPFDVVVANTMYERKFIIPLAMRPIYEASTEYICLIPRKSFAFSIDPDKELFDLEYKGKAEDWFKGNTEGTEGAKYISLISKK